MTFFLLLAHVGGIEHEKVQLCTRCLKADAWLIGFISMCGHQSARAAFLLQISVLSFCASHNGTYKVSASTPAPSDIPEKPCKMIRVCETLPSSGVNPLTSGSSFYWTCSFSSCLVFQNGASRWEILECHAPGSARVFV